MLNDLKTAAADLVEAHKTVAPFEETLNVALQEFSLTVRNFYKKHNIYGAGKYAWAANLGFNHATAHDIRNDGVLVTLSSFAGDITTRLVTFDEFTNIERLLSEDLADVLERRRIQVATYDAARQIELEAELAALNK